MDIPTHQSTTSINTRLVRALRCTMALLLIASAFVVSAPARADTGCPAGASGADCYFLTQIRRAVPLTQNIDDATVTGRGRQLCADMESDAVNSGPAAALSHEYNKFLQQSGLGDYVVTTTLHYSIAAYCPDISAAASNSSISVPPRPGTNSNVPLLCDGIEAASQQCSGYTNLPVRPGPQFHSNVPINCDGIEAASLECSRQPN